MTLHLTPKQFELQREDERRARIRTNPPEVMSAEDIAIFLDRHLDTIYSMVALGTIPCKKDGRRVFFLRDHIREWLRDGEQPPKGAR